MKITLKLPNLLYFKDPLYNAYKSKEESNMFALHIQNSQHLELTEFTVRDSNKHC